MSVAGKKAEPNPPSPEPQQTPEQTGESPNFDLSGQNLLKLQRTLGNRVVQRLINEARDRKNAVVSEEHRCTPACIHNSVERTTDANTIQRHASFEHKLLGDVSPDKLDIIPRARQAKKDNRDELVINASGRRVSIREEAQHLLTQEMERLRDFQNNPPTEVTSPGEVDPHYGVSLVEISENFAKPQDTVDKIGSFFSSSQARAGKLIATYGEINTLADYYGTYDDLKKADPQTVYKLLQGVRQQTYLKLEALKKELSDSKLEKFWLGSYTRGFSDSQGATGRNYGNGTLTDVVETVSVGSLTKEDSGAQQEDRETGRRINADSALARNACHFAPQSWYNWKENHERARALAREAYEDKQAGKTEESKKKANEALLINGFGDHYLQDSFAGGHLINKTLIMQWWIEYVQNHGGLSEWLPAILATAAEEMTEDKQGGLAAKGLYSKDETMQASDPETSEKQKTNSARFNRSGLQAAELGEKYGDLQAILNWWFEEATKNPRMRRLSPNVLSEKGGFGFTFEQAKAKLQLIEQQRLAKFAGNINPGEVYGTSSDANLADFKRVAVHTLLTPVGGAIYERATTGKSYGTTDPFWEIDLKEAEHAKAEPQEQFEKRVALNDYAQMMNSAFIQISTNVLHNYYCEHGLLFYPDGADESIQLRLYGDNNMLNASAENGVKYSAETANRSYKAITDLIQNGATDETKNGVTAIMRRFPNKVKGETGTPVSLEEWHTGEGQLKKSAQEKFFPELLGSAKALALSKKGSLMGGLDDAKVIRAPKHDAGDF